MEMPYLPGEDTSMTTLTGGLDGVSGKCRARR